MNELKWQRRERVKRLTKGILIGSGVFILGVIAVMAYFADSPFFNGCGVIIGFISVVAFICSSFIFALSVICLFAVILSNLMTKGCVMVEADEDGPNFTTLLILLGVCFIIMIATIIPAYILMDSMEQTEYYSYESSDEYDIFYCDAPFGRYWIDTDGEFSGTFILFAGHMSGESNTNLRESYTIKYMVGNELETIIISSTNPDMTVILTEDNTTMTFVATNTYKHTESKLDSDKEWIKTVYAIYIPDPRLFER